MSVNNSRALKPDIKLSNKRQCTFLPGGNGTNLSTSTNSQQTSPNGHPPSYLRGKSWNLRSKRKLGVAVFSGPLSSSYFTPHSTSLWFCFNWIYRPITLTTQPSTLGLLAHTQTLFRTMETLSIGCKIACRWSVNIKLSTLMRRLVTLYTMRTTFSGSNLDFASHCKRRTWQTAPPTVNT